MSSEQSIGLSPELADLMGAESVANLHSRLGNRSRFSFIREVAIIPRETDLDHHGVDLIAHLHEDHPLPYVLGSSLLNIQSKSQDRNCVEFLAHRVVNPLPDRADIAIPLPMVVLNGQRSEEENMTDLYTQLFLYMGLLHDERGLLSPHQWRPYVTPLLETGCSQEAHLVLNQLDQGTILRRNRGINNQELLTHPYFFMRRPQTLARMGEIFPELQGETCLREN